MLDECAAEWSANQSARLTTAASRGAGAPGIKYLERETGFEPATSTLARSHSTTELFPLARKSSSYHSKLAQNNPPARTSPSPAPSKHLEIWPLHSASVSSRAGSCT